jgi:hypothetical protein
MNQSDAHWIQKIWDWADENHVSDFERIGHD